jgi:4-amino-4-deoxy-L-arabinose transferase-like glycosyltransferase
MRFPRVQRLVLLWIVLIAVKSAVCFWMSKGMSSTDEQLYRQLAHSLALGEGYIYRGHPTAVVVPGFPLILAAVFRVAPDNPILPYVANVLLSAIAALAYGWLCGLLTGRPRLAVPVAVILFFFPSYIQHASRLTTEMANAAFLALSLLFFERSRRHPAAIHLWALMGLCVAATFMVRPVTFLITPAFLLWPLAEARFRPRALAGAVVGGVVILLVWLPWVFRNWSAFGEFVPLSSYSGMTLYSGTLEDFHEFMERIDEELRRGGIDDYFADEVGSNRYLTRVAKERIAAHPVHYLLISARRSWRFWIYDFPWQEGFLERWRSASSIHDYLRLLGRPLLQLMSVLLLAALLASIWTLRRRRDCWPYFLLLLYCTVMHALLFPIIRYSVPVQGLAIVLIATAAVQIVENRKAHGRAIEA